MRIQPATAESDPPQVWMPTHNEMDILMDRKNIDNIDWKIIRILSRNARTPASDISQALAIPESTVRFRINRLTKNNVIKLTAVSNPVSFGYNVWVNIHIEADIYNLNDVIKTLNSNKNLYFVGMTSGEYNIIVTGLFESNDDLIEFNRTVLGKTAGILRVSTLPILSVSKRELSIDFEADE
jgi:Lrp/AsnC family transcriptional regulator for asnA, asnC and gidA